MTADLLVTRASTLRSRSICAASVQATTPAPRRPLPLAAIMAENQLARAGQAGACLAS